MENLNRLLEISVYAVLLFFIVIAIKRICRDKLSPTQHFVIWFMPIARLCIPFTIDSGIRLIVIPTEIVNTLQPYGQLQRQPPSRWTDCFFIVWLGGILLLSIRMVVNIAKIKHVIKRHGIESSSRMEEMLSLCRKELGVRKNIKLLMLPNVTTPALTIGFLPKIVMPVDIHECLNEKQLELVIKHELMHYKRRDHLVVLLLRIIEIIYWFNPVVWLMCRFFSLDMEAACDSMVVRDLDNQRKRHYALSLVQLSSQGRMLKFVLNMVFGNNEKIVEKRIRGIFLKCRRKSSAMIAAGAMAVILFISCFTTIFQPVVKNENIDHNEITGAAYITAMQEESTDLYNNRKILYHISDDSDVDAIGITLSYVDTTGSFITLTGVKSH